MFEAFDVGAASNVYGVQFCSCFFFLIFGMLVSGI